MRLLSESVTSTAYKVTRTVTGVECDVCEKVIPASWHDENSKYFEVTTGHHDWGSESIESRETIDVCPECLLKYISDYFKNASTTAYLEVETERAYPDTESRVVDSPRKENDVIRQDHDGDCF